MLAFWSHEGVVFLPSSHLVTSSRLPYLGSTDTHWPCLGAPFPLLPRWRPFPQGPRTLPHRGSEQNCAVKWNKIIRCRAGTRKRERQTMGEEDKKREIWMGMKGRGGRGFHLKHVQDQIYGRNVGRERASHGSKWSAERVYSRQCEQWHVG